MNHPAKNKKKTVDAIEDSVDERNLIDLDEAVTIADLLVLLGTFGTNC